MRKAFALFFLILSSPALASDPKVTIVSRAYQPGEIFAVVVESDFKPNELEGNFLNRPLHFFPGKPGTALTFTAIDLDDSVGKFELVIHSAKGIEPAFTWKELLTVAPKKFGVERLTVDKNYVEPSKEEMERIQKEQKEQEKVFATVSTDRFWTGNFLIPLSGKRSGRFGKRRYFNNEMKRPHGGEDLKAKEGTPVKATAKGKIVLAKSLFFSGNMIVIDHGFGLFSYYAHLSKMDVKVGDIVDQAQEIGLVGETGRVTGPHLHWGVKLNESRVDPFGLKSLDLKPYLPEPEVIQTAR